MQAVRFWKNEAMETPIAQEVWFHESFDLKLQVEDVFIKVARMILNKIEDGGVAHSLILHGLEPPEENTKRLKHKTIIKYNRNHNRPAWITMNLRKQKHIKAQIKHCFVLFYHHLYFWFAGFFLLSSNTHIRSNRSAHHGRGALRGWWCKQWRLLLTGLN